MLSALRRQRQAAELCEFKASLVYIVSLGQPKLHRKNKKQKEHQSAAPREKMSALRKNPGLAHTRHVLTPLPGGKERPLAFLLRHLGELSGNSLGHRILMAITQYLQA